jgi:hypothetical protein
MHRRRNAIGEGIQAVLLLLLFLSAVFFPALFGGKTLLCSAWSASVTPQGAYTDPPSTTHHAISPDPGAPAWQSEAWVKIISQQYWKEGRLPLWNPYSAYGTPFAAAMQPQPFYPPMAALSLHATPFTYNLFIVARLFLAGLLTFFFVRLFLPYAASLFAAFVFTLNGYFIMYLDMPHLSVEVMLPAILLAFELLVRLRSWITIAASAVAISLSLVGGMPESSFLVIAFGCLFFLYRFIFAHEAAGRRLKLSYSFALAVILGFALSAVQLAPFLEFMRNAHDTHQATNIGADIPGPISDPNWQLFSITYLLPGLLGSVLMSAFGNDWSGVRGSWGILPTLFAIAALVNLVLRQSASPSARKSLTLFFFLVLVFFLFKRFGSPVVNWIGYLPVANLVLFVKYEEPLMAFCIAVLAGIGLSIVVGTRNGPQALKRAVVVLLAILGLMIFFWWPVLHARRDAVVGFYSAIFVALFAVGCAVFLLQLTPQFPRARWLSWSLAGLLCAELFFDFAYPNFYHGKLAPADKYDPYAGAPYIAFLQQRNKNYDRVFGRDGILYPNWAGVFDLMDVRDLDAMYSRRYLNFIRSFLLRLDDTARVHGDLADRFTGTGDGYTYDLTSDLERRFLTLSSARYILSVNQFRGAAPETPSGAAFKRIYDKEIGIFEFVEALPRATMFHVAEIVPDERALDRLRDPVFRPGEKVLVSEQSLGEAERKNIESMATIGRSSNAVARIVSYASQRVQIEANSESPAILMLNDTNYPGWRARVNGEDVAILQADYLFRGVIVPAGHAIVEFDYVPNSFHFGAIISAVAFVVVIVPLFGFGLGQRHARAPALSVTCAGDSGGSGRKSDREPQNG